MQQPGACNDPVSSTQPYRGSSPASGSFFAMVDGEYEHLTSNDSTYTSKFFALCMFHLSSESITLQLAKTQCLFFDTLTVGSAADQTLF